MEKNSYQKDVKYLGINNKYSKNSYKGSGSDSESDAFSWRKGSGGTKSSFDSGEKPFKKNNYYKYKRNRFNSDNDGKKYKNNNYYQNYGSRTLQFVLDKQCHLIFLLKPNLFYPH